ncbi:MAG: AraC family transcriptional regulator [Acidimicrobiales bacterium]
MDALASLVAGPRASGAHLVRAVMEPPWSISVEDHSPLALVAVTRGSLWFRHSEHSPIQLEEGTIALVQGPDPYIVSHSADAEPTIVVLPGNDCRSLDGRSIAQAMRLGVRSWGTASLDGPPGPHTTEMLIGAYESVGAVGQRVLATIPSSITTTAHALDSPLVELLGAEIDKAHPGQPVVLDRLLDLLVVAVLRAWLTSCSHQRAGWFQSHLDDVVGPAVALLHDHPERPWTVAGLAAEVGVSRAALARRFTELVGQPPMTYLTEWRLALAADLLAQPGATVTSVSREVGYSTPYAFSAAFKRVRGISPAEHRHRARA